MQMTPEDRRILTFYSFKGGVGRTMLLANTAYRLANKHGLRVIAVDWDLEAAQKQGFDWFMRKEIYEQPRAVADSLLGLSLIHISEPTRPY